MAQTCGVKADGSAWCWGQAGQGQLGTGDRGDSSSPRRIAGSAYDAVATGWQHGCATPTSGAARCWGLNHVGQLGDGSTATRLVPTAV